MSEDYPMMKGRHAELDFWSYLHWDLQLPPLPLDFMALVLSYPLNSFPFFTPPSCSHVVLFVLRAPFPSHPYHSTLLALYVLEMRDNKADVWQMFKVRSR